MDRKPAVILVIRTVVQLLDDLGVQHADKIAHRGIVVRNNSEDRHLLFTQFAEVHVIAARDAFDLFQVKRRETDGQRDVYAFCCFARRLLVHAVLLYGNMVRLVLLQLIEQQIQRRGEIILFFLDLRVRKHLHDHSEVLFLNRRFIQQIEHQGFQQRGLRLFPEGIIGVAALGGGVPDQVRDQLQHVLVVPYVHERVIRVGLREVHEVEHLHDVTFFLQQATNGLTNLAFRRALVKNFFHFS